MSDAGLYERDERYLLIANKSARNRAEDSRRFRNVALLYACLAIMGAHFTKHALGPMKPYFLNDLNYTNTEFGMYLAAPSVPNLIFPILSGIFLDATGYERGAVLFTTLALIGNIVFTIAIVKRWFIAAIIGRIVFGVGESGAGIVQSVLILSWFRVSSLNFALGVGEGAIYLSSFAGKVLPAIMIQHVKFSSPTLDLNTNQSTATSPAVFGLCICSFFLFLSALSSTVYYFLSIRHRPFVFALSRKPSKSSKLDDSNFDGGSPNMSLSSAYSTFPSSRIRTVDDEEIEPRESMTAICNNVSPPHNASIREIMSLPTLFWVLGLLHAFFSNCYNLFGGISTDLIVERSEGEYSIEHAALLASVDAALPIIFAPMIGLFVDKYGGRLWICFTAACCCLIGFSLLLSPLRGEFFNKAIPIIALILFSVSTCSTPTLIKSGMITIVPPKIAGSALGIFTVLSSIGAILGHVTLGYLRDSSPTKSYDNDLIYLICLSVVLVLASLFSLRLQRQLPC